MNPTIKALLLRTDGTSSLVRVRVRRDYARHLGGTPELLATRTSTVCYVRKDGRHNEQLARNPYSPLLRVMGFDVGSVGGRAYVLGDALLCVTSHEGHDASVSPLVLDTVRAYDAASDRELFLMELCNARSCQSDDETSDVSE